MANIFKFNPLLKQTIWGGERIIPFKHMDSQLDQVGESWEISGVKGHETTVAGGPYDGLGANALYVMDSAPEARLMVGLNRRITPEEYKRLVEDDTICDAINSYAVKEGDCFYIPSGRIHSIGAGCFLAEIQQTSDITYRIYDFKRPDRNGRLRQLHTAEAAEVIDYEVAEDYHTAYLPARNEPVGLISCQYFRTALYDLDEPMALDYSELDSFVVLIGLKGEGVLALDDGSRATLNAGETVLLPATTDFVMVSGKIKFLETYV